MTKGTISPYRLLLMSSAGMYLDGYQLTVVSLAVLVMKPDLNLSQFDASLLIDSLILGTIIGAISIGYLADRFGRRRVYMYNLLFFVIFGLGSVVTSNLLIIILLRVLMGISIGADYPISNSYIAEMAPENLRGKFLSFSNVAFFAGALTSGLIAMLLFFLNFPNSSWRYMIGIGLIPAVIVLFARMSMPESERWENVMRTEKKRNIRKMFHGKAAVFTILTSIIWLIFDLGSYGVGLLVPSILKGSNFAPDSGIALATSIFLIIGLASGAIVIMIVDRIGRRYIQMLGFLGMGIGIILIPYTFATYLLVVVLAFSEFSAAWPGATVGIFPAELATTEYRSSAYGLAAMMGKLGAVIGVLIIGSATTVTTSNSYLFVIIGVIMFVALGLTILLKETRKMKLDEPFLLKV
ncbi:MAG: MFS transporter [Thermoplasmataceae archaeon]